MKILELKSIFFQHVNNYYPFTSLIVFVLLFFFMLRCLYLYGGTLAG